MFRRVLSLILCLCIVLTSMPALSVYALAEGEEEAIVAVAAEETEETEEEPTPEPTEEPTPEPTEEPTPEPTEEPTPEPVVEEPVTEEPVVEEPVVEEPVVEEPVVEEPVVEEPVVEEPVVEEPVVEEPVVEEPVVEEPVVEEPVVEEPVVEEPVVEEPAVEEPVVEEIENLTDDEDFDEGYVRILKEARVYLDAEEEEYALDAAKGSVAYALSRPNAGKETDRLKVVLSVDGEAFEGYVDAEKLLPLSEEDVLAVKAELDGEEAVYVDEAKECPLPAAKVTLKPAEDETEAPEEDAVVLLPVEPEQEEEAEEEESAIPSVGGFVPLIPIGPEADEPEADEEEAADEEAGEAEEPDGETKDPAQEEVLDQDVAVESDVTIGQGGVITETVLPEEEDAPDKFGGEYKTETTEDPLNQDIDLSAVPNMMDAVMTRAETDEKGFVWGTFSDLGTSHPYRNDAEMRWYVDFSDDDEWGNVICTALYFDANTYLEKNKDYLIIYDYRGKVISKYTGDQLAGRHIVVPGNKFVIYCKTDASGSYYGFEIDKFIAYNQAKITYAGTNEKGKPTFGWEEVYPKQGYEIWRAQFNTNTGYLTTDYKKVKSGTGKFEYTDTSAKDGCAYSYKLRLYSTVGSTKFYTGYTRLDLYALKAPTVSSIATRKSGDKYYVDLTWKKVAGAQEYYIYRRTDPDDTSGTIFTVSNYRTSFTDTTITEEGTYIYNVIAGGNVGDVDVQGGWSANQYALCNEATASYYLDDKGYVVLEWPDNDYAPGIKIERAKIDAKTGKIGKYAKVAEIDSGTTYTDKKAKAGSAYAYRLSNYFKSGSKKYYSVAREESVYVPASTTLTGTGAVANASVPMVDLKWKAVKDATYYRLLRAEIGSDTFTLVKNVYGTSTTDYPDDFAMYQYAIQPIVVFDGQTFAAPWSPVKVYGYPTAPNGLRASGVTGKKVTLEWEAVEGVTGYYVYRYDWKSASYKRIGVSKTPKYTDSKANPGEYNYYYVMSYVKVGKNTIESDYVTTVSVCPLAQPKITVTKTGTTSVQVSWKPIDYAQKYEVYASSEKDGPYSLVSARNALYSNISVGAAIENAYFYVCAVRQDGDVISRSEESAVKSVLMNKIEYRAVVVGQNDYVDSSLRGAENDSKAMAKMLGTMSKTKYSVTRADNMTAAGIVSQIHKVFSQADLNDVTLFYYSGHAMNDGSLVGVDRTYITPDTFRQILDQYEGKKVIILDTCYSGNMIGKSVDDFNDNVISAFSKKTKANLAAQDYYVMTACSKAQLSTETLLTSKEEAAPNTGGNTPAVSGSGNKKQREENEVRQDTVKKNWVGVFTTALTYGCGWNEISSSKIGKLYADKNGDKAITLNEAYKYTVERVDYLGDLNRLGGFDQDAQVYPTNSSQKLFSR